MPNKKPVEIIIELSNEKVNMVAFVEMVLDWENNYPSGFSDQKN